MRLPPYKIGKTIAPSRIQPFVERTLPPDCLTLPTRKTGTFTLLSLSATLKPALMKILFLSDIHGSLPALDAVLSFYDAHHYELLVLLGDLLNYGPRNGVCNGLDAMAVADKLNQRAEHIVCVRGNCDSEVDQMLLVFPIQSTYTLVVDEGRKFFITHGHIFNEKHMPLGPSCDVFVYGHTHCMTLQAADPRNGRPAILNTGSPTFPKNGNPPTFATYEDGCLSLRSLDGKTIQSLRL